MKKDIIIIDDAAGFGRMAFIPSFNQTEARLAAYYAQELSDYEVKRRLASMLAVPYEMLYPEAPKKPYLGHDGSLIIPLAPLHTPVEHALLKLIEKYDPVKYLVEGCRMEWPVWRPRAL